MTVQEAHKEYNSLTDQTQAKYEQLDSGEFGTVDTPAFKVEACESTCSCEPTLPETEPATSKGTLQAHGSSSTEDAFWIKITLGRQFV